MQFIRFLISIVWTPKVTIGDVYVHAKGDPFDQTTYTVVYIKGGWVKLSVSYSYLYHITRTKQDLFTFFVKE